MTRLGGSAKIEMTWFAPRRTWKKKYKGKVYYCPLRSEGGKTDAEGYRAALKWWRSRQNEIDQAVVEPQAGGFGVFGDMTEADVLRAAMTARLQIEYADATAGMANPPTIDEYKEQQNALVMMRAAAAAPKVPQGETVAAYVKAFLELKRGQAETAQRSSGRYANLRSHLVNFEAYLGADERAQTVPWGIKLNGYYARQLSLMAAGELGEYGARDRMQVARQFIRWLWTAEVIDLPRNLDSKEMTISASAAAIKIPDFDDVRKLIADAPETYKKYPLKLWLLLAANCGMTQVDISDLKRSEIDLDVGTITRKRSKKSRRTEKSVPTVCYRLWKSTLAQLRKSMAAEGIYALPNNRGGKLVNITIGATGGTGNVDVVADVLSGYAPAAGITFKTFRKVSSTRLQNHATYGRYAEFFLAHTPKSTADKSYIVPSQIQFNAAIKWLGGQYGQ